MPPPPIALHVPSPVRRLDIDTPGELWVKDDSQICDVYGGNKPRKLVHLLRAATERGARRLVTVGALGSHHVLATGLLGRCIGLATTAIALPRPYSQHAEQTTLQTVAAGVDLIPLGTPSDIARVVKSIARRGDYYIPPGGSNALGTVGYLDAARELRGQIEQGLIPEPDIIVVALGSGGTAAGLLAGLTSLGTRTHLVAASVLHLPMARLLVQSLARAALRRNCAPTAACLSKRLTIDARWIGQGYGYPTAAGELAIAEAASLGLSLEDTYTAKAFACALAMLRGSMDSGNLGFGTTFGAKRDFLGPAPRNGQRILFWSTFSGVSLATAMGSAVTLPPALRRLLRSP